MPHADRKLEFLLRPLQDGNGLGVFHAHKLRVDDALQLGDDALLDALLEERHVVARSLSTALKTCFSSASASAALSARFAKAISGSIIQNSARCRLVLEFSARKVGPKV